MRPDRASRRDYFEIEDEVIFYETLNRRARGKVVAIASDGRYVTQDGRFKRICLFRDEIIDVDRRQE